jgi:1,4-alpha-glucan branching enzyme
MVCNDKKKGVLRFSLSPHGGAQRVAVAGDFNNWKPAPLRKRGDGFGASFSLPPGMYQYKFIVDGTWIIDPDGNQWALSPLGSINSVAVID